LAETLGDGGGKDRLRGTITVPQGVTLYLGAVVGAGVLLRLPSLVSWGFDCGLGIPLALTFATLAARSADAGGVASCAGRRSALVLAR
jgi:amino acid efflux transporter